MEGHDLKRGDKGPEGALRKKAMVEAAEEVVDRRKREHSG